MNAQYATQNEANFVLRGVSGMNDVSITIPLADSGDRTATTRCRQLR